MGKHKLWEPLQHYWIRRKAKLVDLPVDRYRVCLADSCEDYEQAFALVHVCYASLGIDKPNKVSRMTDQHVLPEAHVLIAKEGERVVGTMSVIIDSPAGLPLDKDFPEVLEAVRAPKHRIAEFGSFAVVHRYRHTGLAQLLGMACARLAWSLGCTHTVIGVHPDAAPIYAALWGFQPMGEPRRHADLHAAVAVMMVDREAQREHVRRKYPRAPSGGRSVADLVFGAAPMPNSDLAVVLADGSSRGPKMPRNTFQHLFLRRSDHIGRLGARTLRYVRTIRSDVTLGRISKERAQSGEMAPS